MDLDREPGAAEPGQPAPTPRDESVAGPRPNLLANWRRWIRPAFYAAYGLVVLSTLPLVILDVVNGASGKQSLKITLAGVAFFAMVISIPISVWGIINHVLCFTRPSLQKFIIRILWMVPIYELNSWFALRFPVCAVYLDSLRQLYQAYVIYNFVFYILAFFDEVPNFDNRMIMKPQIKSPPPCCCVKAVPNQRIINRCKAGILSYLIVRIISTAITIVSNLTNTFKEGNYSPQSAYLWVTIMVTSAQIWTMFCMALLRKATRDELQMLPKSAPQFLAIQLVVFVDNFQSVFLNLLAHFGAMNPKPEWGFDGDEYQFARMLQDFLICLEMVFCALFLSYSFGYERYKTGNGPKLTIAQSFKRMWNLSDDRMEHLETTGKGPREHQEDPPIQADQPMATSSTTPQVKSTRPREEAPRKRKTGHQFISLPDIILHHQDRNDVDHFAQIHSTGSPESTDPAQRGDGHPNQNFGDQTLKGGDRGQDPDDGGIRNQLKSIPVGSKPRDDGLGDDTSDDTDESIVGEFLTDDDDSDDNDLPDGTHLTVPQAASPRQRRIKKISYAGMTFEDMDWDQMRGHPDPSTGSPSDSPWVLHVPSIVEHNEKKHKAESGDKGNEGFGNSEV